MRPFPEISKSGLFAFLLIGCTLAAIPSAQAQFSELAQLNNSPLQILPHSTISRPRRPPTRQTRSARGSLQEVWRRHPLNW